MFSPPHAPKRGKILPILAEKGWISAKNGSYAPFFQKKRGVEPEEHDITSFLAQNRMVFKTKWGVMKDFLVHMPQSHGNIEKIHKPRKKGVFALAKTP